MISIQPTLTAVKKSGRWEGLLQKDYLRRGYLSWPLDSEMEPAVERPRETQSRQKEQEAQRPQDKLGNFEGKEEAWGDCMKELDMQKSGEEHSSRRNSRCTGYQEAGASKAGRRDRKGPLMLEQREEEEGACAGWGRKEGQNYRALCGIERVLDFILKTMGRR